VDKIKLELASSYYVNGDYTLAVEAYAELKQEYPTNPLITINLANSSYKLKNYGKAIKNYYEAKKIIPRDKELNNNLSIALKEIELKQPNMIGFSGLNLLESLILVLILNILFIFRNRMRLANSVKTILSILLMTFVINLALVYRQQNTMNYAVVTEISTKAYSGDNSAYSELFVLLDGQIISVVKAGKNWSQIKYDGALGWVANQSFEKI
jgi:tetratricopeptide (TPR) repeat protein